MYIFFHFYHRPDQLSIPFNELPYLLIVVQDSTCLSRASLEKVWYWHLHWKTLISFSLWTVSICFLNLRFIIVILHFGQVHFICCLLWSCKSLWLLYSLWHSSHWNVFWHSSASGLLNVDASNASMSPEKNKIRLSQNKNHTRANIIRGHALWH